LILKSLLLVAKYHHLSKLYQIMIPDD
jgi:hypothetical protein